MEEAFIDWLNEKLDDGSLTEENLKVAMQSAFISQELWNEFAHQDWAFWVQKRIRSMFYLRPNTEAPNGG